MLNLSFPKGCPPHQGNAGNRWGYSENGLIWIGNYMTIVMDNLEKSPITMVI